MWGGGGNLVEAKITISNIVLSIQRENTTIILRIGNVGEPNGIKVSIHQSAKMLVTVCDKLCIHNTIRKEN